MSMFSAVTRIVSHKFCRTFTRWPKNWFATLFECSDL